MGSEALNSKFSYYRKFVNSAIRAINCIWLHSGSEKIKREPPQFFNCVSKYRKDRDSSGQIEVGYTHLTEATEVDNEYLSIPSPLIIFSCGVMQ
jgi:hypothetical protein